jgi:hypothetical protein
MVAVKSVAHFSIPVSDMEKALARLRPRESWLARSWEHCRKTILITV